MDLERFAPFIIFLIVFISILRKKLAKKKKTSNASEQPALKPAANQWLGKLADALNKVKSEVEAAKQKAAEEKGDYRAQAQLRESAQPGLMRDKNVLTVDPSWSPAEELIPASKPRRVKAEPAIEPAPGAVKAKKRRSKKIPLQQAVVWSEILGPPVSLRDDT